MQTKILAIDIGGTNTKLALVNDNGKLDQVLSIPTTNEDGIDCYFERIKLTVDQLLVEQPKEEILGVGIGVAGFIDPAHQKMIFNPNIAWLENVSLRKYFSSELGYPAFLEVDSNAAALAEAIHGNGNQSQRLLVLSIGTGLGGGMVVDGKILRISNGCLGDIGHVIVKPGGDRCASGCHGCAEALVSANTLVKYAHQSMSVDKNSSGYQPIKNGKKLTVNQIIQAIHNQEPAAIIAIRKMGQNFGIALASMIPIFAPDTICVAGGISESGTHFLDATRTSLMNTTGGTYLKNVLIKKAKFGWQAVLVGAAEAFKRSLGESR